MNPPPPISAFFPNNEALERVKSLSLKDFMDKEYLTIFDELANEVAAATTNTTTTTTSKAPVPALKRQPSLGIRSVSRTRRYPHYHGVLAAVMNVEPVEAEQKRKPFFVCLFLQGLQGKTISELWDQNHPNIPFEEGGINLLSDILVGVCDPGAGDFIPTISPKAGTLIGPSKKLKRWNTLQDVLNKLQDEPDPLQGGGLPIPSPVGGAGAGVVGGGDSSLLMDVGLGLGTSPRLGMVAGTTTPPTNDVPMLAMPSMRAITQGLAASAAAAPATRSSRFHPPKGMTLTTPSPPSPPGSKGGGRKRQVAVPGDSELHPQAEVTPPAKKSRVGRQTCKPAPSMSTGGGGGGGRVNKLWVGSAAAAAADEEEGEEKALTRAEKNRLSAARSRARKDAYIKSLEDSVNFLTEENERLKAALSQHPSAGGESTPGGSTDPPSVDKHADTHHDGGRTTPKTRGQGGKKTLDRTKSY